MQAHPPTSDRPDIDVYGYALRAARVPLWQEALVLMRRGDAASALDRMLAIVAAQPDFMPAHVEAANLLLAVGRYRHGLGIARNVADRMPRSTAFALHVIRLLRRFEEHRKIASLVARVDWAACSSAALLAQVAGELGPIGLYRQATNLLDRADRLAPGDRRVQVLRGTIAFVAGDIDGARLSLRAALDSPGPDMPHARWMLTMQPDSDSLARDIDVLSAKLRLAAPGSEDEAYLAFGLHNLLHASSRYEESWQALERGCRVKRGLVRYDRQRQRRLFDALTGLDLKPVEEASEAGAPKVIFIVGMHRSGTSVLERVLAGHNEVADGGESYVFPAAMREVTDHFCRGIVDEVLIERAADADLALAGRRFREYAHWRAGGRSCFTEKLPSNFLNLGFILRAMPDARVLHMKRDPIDTCFSNLRTFFSLAAPYSYDQLDLADYFRMCQGLMQHWHRHFPGRILDVEYQAFVDDPETEAARVMAFCGLDFQPEALDVSRIGGYSATASVGSVRRGILRNRGGAWGPYRKHLAPLLDALGATDAARS